MFWNQEPWATIWTLWLTSSVPPRSSQPLLSLAEAGGGWSHSYFSLVPAPLLLSVLLFGVSGALVLSVWVAEGLQSTCHSLRKHTRASHDLHPTRPQNTSFLSPVFASMRGWQGCSGSSTWGSGDPPVATHERDAGIQGLTCGWRPLLNGSSLRWGALAALQLIMTSTCVLTFKFS